MQHRLLALAVVASASLCVPLAGCGVAGGSGAGATDSRKPGAILINIEWPNSLSNSPTDRLIPESAESIQVVLLQNGAPLQNGTAVISRPTATYQFNSVPPLPTVIQATAYPNSDGSGVPLATGSAQVNVVALSTTTAPDMVMGTTVTSLSVVPSNLIDGINAPFTVDAQALDAGGNIVLVAPDTIQWSSSNTSIITVNPATGNPATLTGVKLGSATITATYTEFTPESYSGTASATVSNNGTVNISIGTPSPTVGTITFGINNPGNSNQTGGVNVGAGSGGSANQTGSTGVSIN